LSADQVTLHTQTWGDGNSRSWVEVDPSNNGSSAAINDWLNTAIVNDAIERARYRINVYSRATSGSRGGLKTTARGEISNLGKSFSEAVQKPIGNINPNKTNAAVDALVETTGSIGAFGLAIGVNSAIQNIANADDQYAALGEESGTFLGSLAGGEIGAGLAAFAVAGVLTGGASVAVVFTAGLVGSVVGGAIGGQAISNLYNLVGK
jgi:hypothetical protein